MTSTCSRSTRGTSGRRPARPGAAQRELDGVEVLGERVTVDARAHAERLTPNVLAALADAGPDDGRCAEGRRGRLRSRAPSPDCGSAWRPRPRTVTRSASPCTGSAASTRSGSEPQRHRRGFGGHRCPPPRGVLGALPRRACASPGPPWTPLPMFRVDADAMAGSPEHVALFDLPRLRRPTRRRRAWCVRSPIGPPRPPRLMPLYLRRPDAKPSSGDADDGDRSATTN